MLREATTTDIPAIATLMRQSVLDTFPLFHDERETAAAARYLTEPDTVLIDDGTYYVHEANGQIVACGGWSKRDKLYTGSGDAPTDDRLLDPATEPARVRAMFVRGDWTRRGLGRAILTRCEHDARAQGFTTLVLMATLPGEPLYRSFGFRERARTRVPLPNGVTLDGVSMEYPLLQRRVHLHTGAFQHRPQFRARIPAHLTGDRRDLEKPRHQATDVLGVRRTGGRVAIALVNERLGALGVEVHVVLDGAGVLSAHDLLRLGDKAFELLQLAVADHQARRAVHLGHRLRHGRNLTPHI
ncbi:GNAT family N-acetyltransferase [Stackebrandtia nassauensis]|uniref:GCN5-related N-acetyltransferase n=1 Tax=Stackebrandtia nassauensis (strain DSM 44728 / CIP 108903 / NRRL B-16338 / NBRC 102104 / LLR-40K-21) TaxID=446470 RepID=D3QBP4_STANL|nr:GNAT family N-acetyltransferase [Stackebrandtia nassauensis]ADD42926.1 GCN5-related N-acetyltransferase [Stackebrandtia nassauensis DSM 44728]